MLDYGPTCFAPSNLAVDNLTSNSAELDWSLGYTETEWNVQYKETSDSVWTSVPGTVTKPYTLQGLNANTSYDFRVRSYCSATDTSEWSDVSTFITLCSPVAPAELNVISFESSEGFVAGSGNMANCWSVGNRQSTTAANIPYIQDDASTAHTGSASMLINAYATATASYDSAYAIMPELILTDPLMTYDLEFYMRKASATSSTNDYNDTLYVGIMSDPADFSTFQQVGYAVNSTTGYEKMTVPFKNSNATNGYVVFLAKYNALASTTYKRAKFYVDDVSLVQHKYAITANSNNETMGNVSLSADTLLFGAIDTLVAIPAANHHFVCWSNGELNDTLFYTVTDDASFTAFFAIDTFAVSVAVTGAEYGSVISDGNVDAQPKYYPYGTIINFTAIPNDHADFVQWSDATTTLTTAYTVVADTIIGATFVNHLYSISVISSDDNMGAVSSSAESGYYGDTVLITATANTGFVFVGWNNGVTDDSIYVVIASDTLLTANFDYIEYNVSVLTADSVMGIVVDVTELAEYHYGDVATFKAVANDGYEFVDWSNGETSDEISLTVISDTIVTANFRKIETGVDNINRTEYIVYSEQMSIVLHGAENRHVICYDASGKVVFDIKSASEDQRIMMQLPGVYMIRINEVTIPIVVK